MVYMRGSRHDYDGWAKELGCSGWGYEDVLPYFIKSESNTNQKLVESGAKEVVLFVSNLSS